MGGPILPKLHPLSKIKNKKIGEILRPTFTQEVSSQLQYFFQQKFNIYIFTPFAERPWYRFQRFLPLVIYYYNCLLK